MIRINDTISIQPDEIEEHFIRAGGPGGQNVNKVATAVQLRFDVRHSASLPERVRRRAETLAGSKLTKDGVIVITANRHRTQEANLSTARKRLAQMIQQVLQPPKRRRKTRPTRGSKERRLKGKAQRSETKKGRGKVDY